MDQLQSEKRVHGWEGKREAGGCSEYHVGLLPSTMNMNMRYQDRTVIHTKCY